MTLTPSAELSAAIWITGSELPWHQLVTMGPAGFEAYARLRFLPDPLYAGQPEITGDEHAPSEHELLHTALEVLRGYTDAPDDCYFCLWDGWGSDAFPLTVRNGPRVIVPNRAFFLLRGSVSDFGDWVVGAEPGQGPLRRSLPDPAFIWPADHAWCIANDVDPHFAGIGAGSSAINELLARDGVDVVAADADSEQPHYW